MPTTPLAAGWTPILSGIVGSVAYGLDGPDSDTDRLMFAAAPTVEFHGLNPPVGRAASHVYHDPDLAVHEIGKALALLLSCNPTINELLWLPDELYEAKTEAAEVLIEARVGLLHQQGVKNAFLGYATQQFRKLKARGGESFSAHTAKRTEKHARHLMRLCCQAEQLYVTGRMNVRVDEPQRYFDFGRLVAREPERGLEAAEALLATTEHTIQTATSALSLRSDEVFAEAWLRRVRSELFFEDHLRYESA